VRSAGIDASARRATPSRCCAPICEANCWRRRCAAAVFWPSILVFAPAASWLCWTRRGNLLEDGVIYPHTPPQTRPRRGQGSGWKGLVRKHQLQVIAIGNGTACRETEEVVSELIADWTIDATEGKHTVVEPEPAPEPETVAAPAPEAEAAPAPEAEAAPAPTALPGSCRADSGNNRRETASGGRARAIERWRRTRRRAGASSPAAQPASRTARRSARTGLRHRQRRPAPASTRPVLSAGRSSRTSTPRWRGTISIGRRLQDPLSELVKIDPSTSASVSISMT